MSTNASRKGDRPIDFTKCRVVIFCSFVEAGLLNCINCNPVPLGTGNHSSRGAFKQQARFG